MSATTCCRSTRRRSSKARDSFNSRNTSAESFGMHCAEARKTRFSALISSIVKCWRWFSSDRKSTLLFTFCDCTIKGAGDTQAEDRSARSEENIAMAATTTLATITGSAWMMAP